MRSAPVYMDYHSTTPVDRRVMDAMIPFFMEHFGNTASVQHRYGWIAKEAADIARTKIAAAINAKPREIVFTGGATESNNLAIKGFARRNRKNGNHIVTVQTEHACVLESCRSLEREGFSVTYLPVDSYGAVNVDEVRQSLRPETILVSVMMANNEIGTIQPVTEIGALCEERGIVMHTDATQAVGKIPIDVHAMHIHLLSFSSHKLYGPKGVGALYVRSRDPRVVLEPQMDGAGHEHGIRSGTLNTAGIVGFGTAVQIAVNEMQTETERIGALRDALQQKLTAIGDVTVNGHPGRRLTNNLSITVHGVTADRMMTEMTDIAVSAGSACLSEETGSRSYSHVLKAIGLDEQAARSTVRMSLGRFTTDEEVDYVAQKFSETIHVLRTLIPAESL
ncbi:MAG: cysteine desulfurase family protein [Bacteroidota bacterium]